MRKLLGTLAVILIICAGLTYEGIGPVASSHAGFQVFDKLSPYHCPSYDLPSSIMWENGAWIAKYYPDGPPANSQRYLGWWAIQSSCSAPFTIKVGANP